MVQGGVTYADTRYGDDIPGGDFVAPDRRAVQAAGQPGQLRAVLVGVRPR